MSFETLTVSRLGPVGWLCFDRPDAGNAINALMFDELEEAWRELDTDPEVRVIVNTGNGRAFQTGLDVGELARNKDALRKSSRQTRDFELRMTAWHCEVLKPVIAAVNGACVGGGLHFVADADIAICADSATFFDPHVSVGQVSAFETIGLVRKGAATSAMRMAFMGRHERLDAQRAFDSHIVSEVVPAANLRERSQELAESIAQHHPSELRMLKAALWRALESP
jgi:enoyl-CoA hydratase